MASSEDSESSSELTNRKEGAEHCQEVQKYIKELREVMEGLDREKAPPKSELDGLDSVSLKSLRYTDVSYLDIVFFAGYEPEENERGKEAYLDRVRRLQGEKGRPLTKSEINGVSERLSDEDLSEAGIYPRELVEKRVSQVDLQEEKELVKRLYEDRVPPEKLVQEFGADVKDVEMTVEAYEKWTAGEQSITVENRVGETLSPRKWQILGLLYEEAEKKDFKDSAWVSMESELELSAGTTQEHLEDLKEANYVETAIGYGTRITLGIELEEAKKGGKELYEDHLASTGLQQR